MLPATANQGVTLGSLPKYDYPPVYSMSDWNMRTKRQVQCETTHKHIRLMRNLKSLRKWSLLLGFALFVIPTGCATVSNRMSGEPDHFGAPPYADDPEANGNPEKAWYN